MSARTEISKGQAAIIIMFVVGMVGLLIGSSLTKTSFGESLRGRGSANSLYAFYVANSGVEDAFYKIKNENFGNPGPESFTLTVGEGIAKVTVSGTSEERTIDSEGKFKNSVRKLHVTAFDATLRPGFAKVIHGGAGGVEFENRTLVSGRDKITGARVPVDVLSNGFVKGADNGRDGETDCSQPASTTRIDGNVYAATSIEGLDGGSGPCIDGNAYANELKQCRIFGNAVSETLIDESECPYNNLCDPETSPEICPAAQIDPLPNVHQDLIKQFMSSTATAYDGDCTIGGANDCSTEASYGKEIGDLIVNGDLISRSNFYVSGPIWVKGNLEIDSNQTIDLSPEIAGTSLIILVSGKIHISSNVTFTSSGNSFLLLASEFENTKPDVCSDIDNAAIRIAANVNSILFYSLNGCTSVENPTASSEFYGAILGEGIKMKNNTNLIYDPALQNAQFYLRRRGGWQITSFTQK